MKIRKFRGMTNWEYIQRRGIADSTQCPARWGLEFTGTIDGKQCKGEPFILGAELPLECSKCALMPAKINDRYILKQTEVVEYRSTKLDPYVPDDFSNLKFIPYTHNTKVIQPYRIVAVDLAKSKDCLVEPK